MALKLRPAVARKYDVVNFQTCIIRPDGKLINMQEMTLKQADQLYRSGTFHYIKPKGKI